MSALEVMNIDGRAVALYADTCLQGTQRQLQWISHLEVHDKAYAAVAELIAAAWRAEILLREMADAGFGGYGPANALRTAIKSVEDV